MDLISYNTSSQINKRIEELEERKLELQKEEFSFEYIEKYYLRCLDKGEKDYDFISNILAGELYGASKSINNDIYEYNGLEDNYLFNNGFNSTLFYKEGFCEDGYELMECLDYIYEKMCGAYTGLINPNFHLGKPIKYDIRKVSENSNQYYEFYKFTDFSYYIASVFEKLNNKYKKEIIEYLIEKCNFERVERDEAN